MKKKAPTPIPEPPVPDTSRAVRFLAPAGRPELREFNGMTLPSGPVFRVERGLANRLCRTFPDLYELVED